MKYQNIDFPTFQKALNRFCSISSFGFGILCGSVTAALSNHGSSLTFVISSLAFMGGWLFFEYLLKFAETLTIQSFGMFKEISDDSEKGTQ